MWWQRSIVILICFRGDLDIPLELYITVLRLTVLLCHVMQMTDMYTTTADNIG